MGLLEYEGAKKYFSLNKKTLGSCGKQNNSKGSQIRVLYIFFNVCLNSFNDSSGMVFHVLNDPFGTVLDA